MSGLLPDDMKELEGYGTPAGAPAPKVPPKPPVPPPPKPPVPAVPTPMIPKPQAQPVTPPKPPMPKPPSMSAPAAPVAPKPLMPPKPSAPAPAKSATPPISDSGSFGGGNGGLRVSLMPSDLEGSGAPDLGKRLMMLALVLVVETLAIGVSYFFLMRTTADRIARKTDVAARSAALQTQTSAAEAELKDSLAWNVQLAAAKQTLDKHVRWTKLFTLLETKTLPTVKYVSFSGDADTGVISLEAVGRSYRDVAEQIVVFRNEPMIADVRTSSAAARVGETGEVAGVSFTVVLHMKPEAWLAAVSAAKP